MLINAANIPSDKKKSLEKEEPSYAFAGGVLGFSFYWLAFVLPFIVYGLNTPFSCSTRGRFSGADAHFSAAWHRYQ